MSPAIQIDGLTKTYGDVTAVDDLSFQVERGTVTGFLGPNGSGKTTTLRMLLGLAEPDHGTATIFGSRYRNLDAPIREVGAVLDTASFHPGRRARDHLGVLAAAAGLPDRRAAEVLDEVGLADVGHRRVKGFSLGMRQRLGLAAALLGDPEVLVLDEPANGLDPEGVHWLREFLRSYAVGGRTVLVSSHLLAEVAQTVDHVVIMAKGRLVRQSTLAELTSDGGVGLEEQFLRLTNQEGPGGMNPLVRSELLKLKTIRSSYANGLAAIAFVPLTMAITVLTAGEPGGPPPLETEEGFRQVMAAASSGTIIAMILGILMVTGEFRHGTAIATFLVTPDRGRVTRAKLIVGAAVGVAIAVATSVATVAIALPWLTARDVAYDFVDGSIAMLFLGSILSTALYVLVGVGVGTLIRNQNAAQAVALVWTFVIETMIVGAAPSVGRWLPGGAAAAMTAAGANDGDLLPAWAGGLVLLAYGLALAAVGTIADRRRDVT